MSDKTKQKKSAKESFIEFVKTIVVAGAIAIVIRTFVFEAFHVPTPSLVPSVLVGDYLFVSKSTYGYSRYSFPFSIKLFEGRIMGDTKPKQGEIAVFRLPNQPDIFYVKRVIGTPGDQIQMIQGVLHVNGKPVELRQIEDYIDTDENGITANIPQYIETLPNGVKHKIVMRKPFGTSRWDNTEIYEVPAGHYFMMGDNRQNSLDSRDSDRLGFVPEIFFVGKAQYIFFSTDAKLWQVWRWLSGIRYSRLGMKVT